jgi:UDP-2,3-diacylglucosamine hydrolase
MRAGQDAPPVAILAGGGALPPLVAAAAYRAGRHPVVFALEGDADAGAFAGFRVVPIRWGGIGRLFRALEESGCREAVFVGGVAVRPDYRAIGLDLQAVRLLPRILPLLRAGDDGLLSGVAAILAERGVSLVSPLAIAPELGAPEGLVAGPAPSQADFEDVEKASEAARMSGALDIGQAAVAVGSRVVAVEGAEGTDALLARIGDLRRAGRIPVGGVLVKCMKPRQDPRLDLPTVGPVTARAARAAGLKGVAVEAGRALLAGRGETVAAFRETGLFLLGLPGGADSGVVGRRDA